MRELWCVIGRGGGKSRMAAAIATHTALLQRHQLAPGETGHVLVLSPTMAQAKIVFGYCLGFIEQSPVLRQEIVSTTQTEIRLCNGVIIGTHPNSFRSVRGARCWQSSPMKFRSGATRLPPCLTLRPTARCCRR